MKNKLEEKALEYARKLQAHIDAKIVYENAGVLTIKTRHEVNLAKEELISLEREILNK